MRSRPSKSKLNRNVVKGKLASCRHRRDDLLMQGVVFVLAREPRITTGCECRRELDGFLLHARARITRRLQGALG